MNADTNHNDSDWTAMGLDYYSAGQNAFEFAESLRTQPSAEHEPTRKQRQYLAKKEREAAKTGQTLAQHKVAVLLRKATRVNQPNFHIETIAESLAMQDKARKIAGASGGGGR